jgi:hypothetical protein
MVSTEKDCVCNIWTNKKIEFKISDYRIELRCSRCHGLVSWWEEHSRTKKIMPSKREWSYEECLAMR